ncbi:MAG: methionine--tRNA ligase [Victivallaceae bacterium]|nr:methionine--tRNA ligase [Victivallaceae bacterium]
MGKDTFYLTTPIYYVNDKPHIGHAYTTILADVLARFHRLLGEPTFFLTGTDEHGQKVQKAAAEKDITPQQQCDETVIRFQELWKRLDITFDRFIRTTQPFHKKVVQEVLQDLYDRDLIYKASYSGWYCVPDERFYTEKDLVDGKCPECGRDVTEIVEENYFFRMSRYQDWLVDYIQTHPDFIMPPFRANETLGFLKKPLNDLCISRPKSRLNWGIELPFDRDYVCYVWFDALINYISGVGYRQDDESFKKWWPASYHLIGKDILTTHTVYWPTMLKAMNVEMPKTIFAHGWWLAGRDKMSKSRGNAVNPMDMVDKYGVDAFRYFLLSEMTMGNDASFTEEAFVTRYNSDLANDLGNLLSRVIKMTGRAGGVVPPAGELGMEENELLTSLHNAITATAASIRDMRLDAGIAAVLDAVRAGNRYLEKTAPWSLAKQGKLDKLNTVLHTSVELLRQVSVLLYPVMPEKMGDMREALGLGRELDCNIRDLTSGGDRVTGCKIKEIEPLFMRIKPDEQQLKVTIEKKIARDEMAPEIIPVTIDDFFRTRLRAAKVIAAEKIEKSAKLLKLQIDLGNGDIRQIVSGIAESYTPEEMTGKTIVVVANLVPAKIFGIESNGMLLAAKSGKKLRLITPDGDVEPGAIIG